jgi:hypothetical protein
MLTASARDWAEAGVGLHFYVTCSRLHVRARPGSSSSSVYLDVRDPLLPLFKEHREKNAKSQGLT